MSRYQDWSKSVTAILNTVSLECGIPFYYSGNFVISREYRHYCKPIDTVLPATIRVLAERGLDPKSNAIYWYTWYKKLMESSISAGNHCVGVVQCKDYYTSTEKTEHLTRYIMMGGNIDADLISDIRQRFERILNKSKL